MPFALAAVLALAAAAAGHVPAPVAGPVASALASSGPAKVTPVAFDCRLSPQERALATRTGQHLAHVSKEQPAEWSSGPAPLKGCGLFSVRVTTSGAIASVSPVRVQAGDPSFGDKVGQWIPTAMVFRPGRAPFYGLLVVDLATNAAAPSSDPTAAPPR